MIVVVFGSICWGWGVWGKGYGGRINVDFLEVLWLDIFLMEVGVEF